MYLNAVRFGMSRNSKPKAQLNTFPFLRASLKQREKLQIVEEMLHEAILFAPHETSLK
jgi:hypothetical protein